MRFDELILKRESCRNFLVKAVEADKFTACLNAARLSPSACNSQPWKLYAANGTEAAAKIREAVQYKGRNGFAENCPAFTVVTEQKATLLPAIAAEHDSQDFAQIDLGLCVAHYCLEATDLGLSTCILGWFDEEKLKAALGLTENEKIRLVLATGYAAADTVRAKKRKELADTVVLL